MNAAERIPIRTSTGSWPVRWLRLGCWQSRLLLLLLLIPSALWLDKPFFTWSQQDQVSGSLPHFRSAATEFGQPVGIAMILLVVWALDRGRRRPLLLAIVATLIAGGAATGLKLAIGRERPYLTEGVSVWRGPHWPRAHQPDSSLPSGHTAAAFALALALSRLYPPARGVFLTFAAACGASRALSGKHYLSDVLVGAWLGWEVAGVVWSVGIRQAFGNWLPEFPWYPRWDSEPAPARPHIEANPSETAHQRTESC